MKGRGRPPQPSGLPWPPCAMAAFTPPCRGGAGMVGPPSALEMTSSSRDGRVTPRVSPTEAQRQPGPAGPLGVFRVAPDRVLRQGSSMARCPWADAWHPEESHSQTSLSLPRVTGGQGHDHLPPRPITPQPPSCWLVLLLSPGACAFCNTSCAPGARAVPGASPAGDPAATTRSTLSGTHTDSDTCILHGVWRQGRKVLRLPPTPQHAREAAREAPGREDTSATPHPGTWANLGGPRDTRELAGEKVTVRRARPE